MILENTWSRSNGGMEQRDTSIDEKRVPRDPITDYEIGQLIEAKTSYYWE